MQTLAIEETVARRFRLAKAPTLVVQPEGVPPMGFTWLQDEGPFRGRTMAVPPEEAFEFQVALAPTGVYVESEGFVPRRSAFRIRSCRDWRYRFCPCFTSPAQQQPPSWRALPLRSMLTSYIATAMGSEAKRPSTQGLRLGH
jgi:hypothetical protein